MPHTINEGRNLFHKFMANSAVERSLHFEVWLLLSEFQHILNAFSAMQWNRSMQWAVDFLDTMQRPGPWIVFNLVPSEPYAFFFFFFLSQQILYTASYVIHVAVDVYETTTNWAEWVPPATPQAGMYFR